MARRIRIQYSGALYHVVSRGDRGGPIFVDDTDRESFLKTLDEACAKASWRIHAYVLMPDHFHLIIKTPEANLVAGMQWCLGTFTTRFNVRHRQRGHVFAGRYKAAPIDPRDGYLESAVDYVHLNPARAGLIQEHQPLRDFPWSSFGSYLMATHEAQRSRPSVATVLEEPVAREESDKSARDFERHTEWRRTQDLNAEFQELRHGWFFGGESFRAELLARVNATAAANHMGPEILQSAEQKAERIVARELTRLEWSEQHLGEHAKGDIKKVRIAEQLRRESTMTLGWIAERLQMGTASHLSHLLYWRRRGVKPGKPRRSMDSARASIPRFRAVATTLPADLPAASQMPAKLHEVTTPTDSQPFTFDPSFD